MIKLKARHIPESNYFGLFVGESQSLRFRLDPNKPITKLSYLDSEMYDVSVNNKCAGGCNYCYISALPTGTNYANVVDKAIKLFDREVTTADPEMVKEALTLYFETDTYIFDVKNVPLSTKPFQVAIGGAGEPTMHPDLPEFLKTLRQLDIVPNYTTNGMHLPPKVLEAADKYVGGVSVTLHPHLEKHWRRALDAYSELNVKLHVHQIIYNKDDIARIEHFIQEYPNVVVVLLPFQHVGFGANYTKQDLEFYDELFDVIVENGWESRIAYGAGFYEYLGENNPVGASLYGPHDYSCYLDLDNDGTLFRTSFEWNDPVKSGIFSGEYNEIR